MDRPFLILINDQRREDRLTQLEAATKLARDGKLKEAAALIRKGIFEGAVA